VNHAVGQRRLRPVVGENWPMPGVHYAGASNAWPSFKCLAFLMPKRRVEIEDGQQHSARPRRNHITRIRTPEAPALKTA
jgi:hypothetical protein